LAEKVLSSTNLRSTFSATNVNTPKSLGFFKNASSRNIKSSLSWDDFLVKVKSHKDKKNESNEKIPLSSSRSSLPGSVSDGAYYSEKSKEIDRASIDREDKDKKKKKREKRENKGSKIKEKESTTEEKKDKKIESIENIKRPSTPPAEDKDKKINFTILSPRIFRPMLSPRKKDTDDMVINEDPVVMLLEFFPDTFQEMINPILAHYADPVDVACYLVRRGWKISSKGEKWLKVNLATKKMTIDELRK